MNNRSVRAEAAAWLARLRYEGRTAADEAAFRAWLAEDAAHGAAFEALSAAWDAAGAYVRDPAPEPLRSPPTSRLPTRPLTRPLTRRVAIGAGAGVVAAVAGVLGWMHMDAAVRYETGPGERRQLTLADRSRVTLDGDSALAVRFSGGARRLTLERGRAYFEVAHDRSRPFMARAGDYEVIALGTAFEIDHAPAALSVLLVEGKVAVRSDRDEAFLRAGDRIVLKDRSAPLRDRPDMARLTAWQRGQLIFDNDRLGDAVAQMARYSSDPMTIDPALAGRRISGAFSTADPAAFARSVGLLLDAPVTVSASGIAIGRSEEQAAPVR